MQSCVVSCRFNGLTQVLGCDIYMCGQPYKCCQVFVTLPDISIMHCHLAGDLFSVGTISHGFYESTSFLKGQELVCKVS